VVALTLPWISVRVTQTSVPVELSVASVPGQGPAFALLLVLTAIAVAVGFSFARQATAVLRLAAVLLGAAPAVAALFVGLNPNTANLRAAQPTPVAGVPDWQNQSGTEDLHVSAMGGLTLYVAGLLFIGLGLAIATLNSASRVAFSPTPSPSWSPRHLALVRWLALGAAAPLIVLSLTLAWFEVDSPDGSMPAVAAGWAAIYRVGLVCTLALLVATALTVGTAQRVLRAAGLYVCGGLNAVLAVNLLLVWDPSGLIDRISGGLRYVHAGPAYFAAFGAVLLVLAVMATSAPVRTESQGEPEEEEERRAEGAERANRGEGDVVASAGEGPEVAGGDRDAVDPRGGGAGNPALGGRPDS
jgi:hypothetical protein